MSCRPSVGTSYPPFGRCPRNRIKRTDALLQAESFQYDGNGNLIGITDRNGNVTTNVYDALDRLKVRTFADGSTLTYSYDNGGRVTSIVDSQGPSITRTYDALDRLLTETTLNGTVNYSYRLDGRRNTMTTNGQPSVGYGYDSLGHVISVTRGSEAVTIDYDNEGNETAIVLPNGIAQERVLDAVGQTTALTYKKNQVLLGDLAYEYDLAGRRTTVSGSWARTLLPLATSATYDPANRLLAFGANAFAYDPNGNLVTDGNAFFSWNSRNELTGVTGSSIASFSYDPEGRRASKVVEGITTGFLYDGKQAIREAVAGGATTDFLNGLRLDQVWARTSAGNTGTLLTDAIGTTIAEADGAGALVSTLNYEPFGRVAVSGTITGNDLEFTGRERDLGNLYYYRARYYSPSTGRFLSEDPAGMIDGPNLYAYGANSPTNTSDPTGLAVSNQSKCDIYVKVEANEQTFTLPCGQSNSARQDGIAVPKSRPGNVFKSVNYVNLVVDGGNNVQLGAPPIWMPSIGAESLLLWQLRDGGWKGADFVAEHNDWQRLFNDSNRRPECNCERR